MGGDDGHNASSPLVLQRGGALAETPTAEEGGEKIPKPAVEFELVDAGNSTNSTNATNSTNSSATLSSAEPVWMREKVLKERAQLAKAWEELYNESNDDQATVKHHQAKGKPSPPWKRDLRAEGKHTAKAKGKPSPAWKRDLRAEGKHKAKAKGKPSPPWKRDLRAESKHKAKAKLEASPPGKHDVRAEGKRKADSLEQRQPKGKASPALRAEGKGKAKDKGTRSPPGTRNKGADINVRPKEHVVLHIPDGASLVHAPRLVQRGQAVQDNATGTDVHAPKPWKSGNSTEAHHQKSGKGANRHPHHGHLARLDKVREEEGNGTDAQAAKSWKSSKSTKAHHHKSPTGAKTHHNGTRLTRQRVVQPPFSPTSTRFGGGGNMSTDAGGGSARMVSHTDMEKRGASENGASDLAAFIAVFVSNGGLVIGMILVFSHIRPKVPMVYSHNVLQQKVPFIPKEDRFGWMMASLGCDTDDVIKHVGLDQAMLLQFAELAMQILMTIGVPMVLIIGPCHAFFGGGASGDSYVSKLGMASIVENHRWLYWLHAVIVWLVVVTVQSEIYTAHGQFLKRRLSWLKMMPLPRASSILVEGIPENMRSEEKLIDFFEDYLGSKSVSMVKIVKQTSHLRSLIEQKEVAEQNLEQAREQHSKTGRRPTHLNRRLRRVDSLALYEGQRAELSREVDAERRRVKQDLSCNTGAAFVTFRMRRDAEIALKLSYTPSAYEYVVSTPPDPTDVIYSEFQRDEHETILRHCFGLALVAGVFVGFLGFLPFLASINDFSSAESLSRMLPVTAYMLTNPALAITWDAMVGSVVLTFFVDFVPSFFSQIFSTFFCQRGGVFLQHSVQGCYFRFMLIFVLFMTAIDSAVPPSLASIASNPKSFCGLLAQRLPDASKFYLGYVALQWVIHAQSLLRFVQLSKFNAFSVLFDEATAKEKSEPEDQDYYGMGARSARFSFVLAICLVFCSLSPLICAMGFLNFALCRVVYGYLLVFAETPRPDSGGMFWVTKLKQVQQCMFVYIMLMAGVIFHRANTWAPGVFAVLSLAFMIPSYARFDAAFRWDALSMEDVTSDMELSKRASSQKYEQPELAVEAAGNKAASSQFGDVFGGRLARLWSASMAIGDGHLLAAAAPLGCDGSGGGDFAGKGASAAPPGPSDGTEGGRGEGSNSTSNSGCSAV